VEVERMRVSVIVQGSIAPLVQALAGLPIEHIAADPLLLDDIFYGVYDAPHAGSRPGEPAGGSGEVA
jgi:hypothetical protein